LAPLVAAALPALALACHGGFARAACDPSFFCETVYPSGPNPHSLVVGDFNADGILDVAIANAGGSVTVHFGRGSAGHGDGTFAPAVSFPVPGMPFGIAAGDFNGDGILDLVTSNYGSNNVSVLLGQGVPGPADGTFAPAVDYPVGQGPFAVTTGDFNGDGITDLAVTLNPCSSGRIAILLGHSQYGVADGTFGSPTTYAVGCYPAWLQARDVDGDGILDLAAAVFTPGDFVFLKGIGNGTFAPATVNPTLADSYDLRFADFNGDGIEDAAVSGVAGLSILIGRGAGLFAPFQGLSANPLTGLEVGDFDRDGINDIVVVNANASTLQLYRGLSTGGAANGQFALALDRSVGSGPIQIATGDFDSDGRPDLAVANYNGNSLSILLDVGPGHGTPEAAAGWARDGVALSRAPGAQTHPQAAPDGADGAIAVWEDRRTGMSSIYAQRVSAGGAVLWSVNGIPVDPDSNQTTARVAGDGQGGAWIGWVQPSGASTAEVRLRHLNAAGEPEATSHVISAPGFDASDLALRGDGAGGVLVAYAGAGAAASAALYCQHVTAGRLGAPGWPAGGIAVAEWSTDQSTSFTAPDVGPDGTGGAAITWRTRRASSCGAGTCDTFYSGAARLAADGSVLSSDGFRFEEDGAYGASSGAGSRLIAALLPDNEIVVQRIDAAGDLAWTTPLAATTGGDRRIAALAPQSDGGASAVWMDRGSGGWNLFVSRVSADGSLASGWPANGLGVCFAAGDAVDARALASYDQGLTLFWTDHRGGDADLYALELDASGRLQGPPGGSPVCAAAGDETAPVLVAGAAGAAIAVWQDARGDNGDIYAQRITDPSIVNADPAPAHPPGLALRGARPNPARGLVWAAFSLPNGGPASLELFDIAGRRVAARDVGTMGAGSHLASLNPAAPPPSGIYVMRLRTPDRVLSARVVLTR
jgi:hypothetical protein